MREFQSTSYLVCHAASSESDKIVINGNEEEVVSLSLKMEQERAKIREKKQKKAKNRDAFANRDSKNMDVFVDRVSLDKIGQKDDAKGQSVYKVPGIHAKRKGEEIRDSEEGNGEDKAKAALKKFRAIDHARLLMHGKKYMLLFSHPQRNHISKRLIRADLFLLIPPLLDLLAQLLP